MQSPSICIAPMNLSHQLRFERFDVPKFPYLEDQFLSRTNGELRGSHPCYQLVRWRIPHELSNVLSGKFETTKALSPFHYHWVYFTVVTFEWGSYRHYHSRESFVANFFESGMTIKAQARRADFFDALDLTSVPDLTDKNLDEFSRILALNFVWCWLMFGIMMLLAIWWIVWQLLCLSVFFGDFNGFRRRCSRSLVRVLCIVVILNSRQTGGHRFPLSLRRAVTVTFTMISICIVPPSQSS